MLCPCLHLLLINYYVYNICSYKLLHCTCVCYCYMLFYLTWWHTGVNMSNWWVYWCLSSNNICFLILLPDIIFIFKFGCCICIFYLFYILSAYGICAFCVFLFVQFSYMWHIYVSSLFTPSLSSIYVLLYWSHLWRSVKGWVSLFSQSDVSVWLVSAISLQR